MVYISLMTLFNESFKTMTSNPTEKYKNIVDDLKKQIDLGSFKEKMPGQRQLAEMYSVNVITMRKALTILEKSGIIEKKPCKGIFIKKLNTGISNTQMIGCLLPTQGHLYSEMTDILISRLQAKGYFPLMINTLRHQMRDNDFIVQFEKIIGTEPSAIIVDGYYDFPYRIFNNNCRYVKNLTIIFRNEHPFQNALKVLSDEFEGGCIGGTHLMNQGCKKIIFLHPPEASFLLRPSSEKILKGFESVVKKSSVKIKYCIAEGGRNNISELRTKIKEWHPDAIFASADYLLEPVYEFILQNNIRVPQDIALLGYYNTPWTEAYPVPLSSISIEAEKLIGCAVEKTIKNINGSRNTETVMVKPSLNERKSSLKRDF